ncbi:hypothetical protein MNBD_GAMMA19-165 [hydrothermal vent metagenome]|uniref:Uncharacterized protein n=1 Tax=hydrothermal vent metagenome TaxID=652676 RepID=A0A3B1AC42_9ZZZZ
MDAFRPHRESFQKDKHKESKRGIGKRATSEATRDGETVVLAERSTAGLQYEDRESGEV